MKLFFAFILFFTIMNYSKIAWGSETKSCFLSNYDKLKPLRVEMLVNTTLLSYQSPSERTVELVTQYINVSEDILEIEYRYWIDRAKESNIVGMSQPYWVRNLPVPYFSEREIAVIESVDKEFAALLAEESKLYSNLLSETKNEKGTQTALVMIKLKRYVEKFKKEGEGLARQCHEFSKKANK